MRHRTHLPWSWPPRSCNSSRTLSARCNASEYISQTRHTHVLKQIDSSWGKYATDEFSDAEETLFGDTFKSNLAEKDTALAKAVSITKKHQKEVSYESGHKSLKKDGQFFSTRPSCQVQGQAGQILDIVQSAFLQSEGEFQLQEKKDAVPDKLLQTPIPHTHHTRDQLSQ